MRSESSYIIITPHVLLMVIIIHDDDDGPDQLKVKRIIIKMLLELSDTFDADDDRRICIKGASKSEIRLTFV